ncbi:MAG: S41 family peptidase [Patescibacteria group bacterium]
MSSFGKNLSKNILVAVLGVGLIGSAFVIGARYGAVNSTFAGTNVAPNIVNKDSGQPENVDFSLFWRAWDHLNEKFVETHGTSSKAITDEDKVYGAIKGLAESLGDPYTTFFPPQENKDFQAEISGNFEGVGMEVGTRDDILTVIAPLKNTPAFKAGVKAGDKILKIDNTVSTNMSADEAVSLIKGKKGTTVTLTLLGTNDSQPREVKIVRDRIEIPTLDTELRSDGIYVIKLYSFTSNSANLFRGALEQFVKSKNNKLIIDLRGNPGGYLDAAIDMASWFLPADKIVVQEDKGSNSEKIVYKSKGYNIFNNNLKVVVLVDGGSASASEILAGALQENGVGKLVGTKTFGKGSVQELVNLNPDTSLKITIARWLTPKGNTISEQGLKPDVEVKVTDADIEKKIDAQLNKAVELLLAK